MSSPSLPPGYSPPSTVVTDNDHSGWLTITNGVMLCNVLLFLGVRLHIRFAISPPFRRDDATFCLATVLFVIQSAFAFLHVSRGFGKSRELIGSEDLVHIQKLGYTNDILYLLDLFLSKSCVFLLLLRLTSNKAHVRLFQALLGFTTLWAIVSIFLVALRCHLSQPWMQYDVQCSGLLARWIFITASNIFIEVALFFGSVLLVLPLQMAGQKKTIVMMVFGCRLPLIAITVLHLNYLTIGFRSSNPTLEALPAVLVSQIELGWSLISATIPCLNPFMRAVSTSYGAMDSDTIIGGDHVSNMGKPSGAGSSYGLRSIIFRKNTLTTKQTGKSTTSVHSGRRESAAQEIIIHANGKDYDRGPKSPRIYRGDHSSNTARVFSEGRVDADSIGGESNDSTKMIIKKEVQWFVESDKNTVSTVHTGAASVEMADQNTKGPSEL